MDRELLRLLLYNHHLVIMCHLLPTHLVVGDIPNLLLVVCPLEVVEEDILPLLQGTLVVPLPIWVAPILVEVVIMEDMVVEGKTN